MDEIFRFKLILSSSDASGQDFGVPQTRSDRHLEFVYIPFFLPNEIKRTLDDSESNQDTFGSDPDAVESWVEDHILEEHFLF